MQFKINFFSESEWVPVEKSPDPIIAPPVVPPPLPPVPIAVPGSEPFYAMNSAINPPVITYPTVNYNNGYANTVAPAPTVSTSYLRSSHLYDDSHIYIYIFFSYRMSTSVVSSLSA